MKTLTKTIAAFAGLLLLAGCAATAAEDTTPKAAGPGYGPGWRHEEMIKARQSGQFGPGQMMMNRVAADGQTFGPGRKGPPLNADGTVDTTKLPPGCPYNR